MAIEPYRAESTANANSNLGIDAEAFEQRWAARKGSKSSAVILDTDLALDVPCAIRDISTTGAKLELVECHGNLIGGRIRLPAYFTVQIPRDRMEVDCAIVWRRSALIGVRFISTPRTLTRTRQ